jgi:hypothetical protein
VGFPRLLLPLPLKVVQPEAMAAQQVHGASARRDGAAATRWRGVPCRKHTHARTNFLRPHEARRRAGCRCTHRFRASSI